LFIVIVITGSLPDCVIVNVAVAVPHVNITEPTLLEVVVFSFTVIVTVFPVEPFDLLKVIQL
jgi:hypothetical protein